MVLFQFVIWSSLSFVSSSSVLGLTTKTEQAPAFCTGAMTELGMATLKAATSRSAALAGSQMASVTPLRLGPRLVAHLDANPRLRQKVPQLGRASPLLLPILEAMPKFLDDGGIETLGDWRNISHAAGIWRTTSETRLGTLEIDIWGTPPSFVSAKMTFHNAASATEGKATFENMSRELGTGATPPWFSVDQKPLEVSLIGGKDLSSITQSFLPALIRFKRALESHP